MTEEDKKWVETSVDSGNKYGYPKCCVDEFISKTPSQLRANKPTSADKLRFQMAHVDGKFSGFVPCEKHGNEIKEGKIKIAHLIDYKKREVWLPFPHDWSLQ